MSSYFSTSRNNHSNRVKLINSIRKTGSFNYDPATDTCKCYICESKLALQKNSNYKQMECDHIIPISAFPINHDSSEVRKAAYKEANNISNLGPLCKDCNRSKRSEMSALYTVRAMVARSQCL